MQPLTERHVSQRWRKLYWPQYFCISQKQPELTDSLTRRLRLQKKSKTRNKHESQNHKENTEDGFVNTIHKLFTSRYKIADIMISMECMYNYLKSILRVATNSICFLSKYPEFKTDEEKTLFCQSRYEYFSC